MDIKEVRKVFQDMVDKNAAILSLGDALDAAESILAKANAAEQNAEVLRDSIQPLKDERDQIVQSTTDLQIHYDNLKKDLDAEHNTYEENHSVKMADLRARAAGEEANVKAANKKLKGENSNLENEIAAKQAQLDEINTILNSKR